MNIDTNLFFNALGFVLARMSKSAEHEAGHSYQAAVRLIEKYCRETVPTAFVEPKSCRDEIHQPADIVALIDRCKSFDDFTQKKDLGRLGHDTLVMMHKQLEERANEQARLYMPDDLLKVLIIQFINNEKYIESEGA